MGFFTWLWDYLLWIFWATEMDVTIVGLQNAGKTSLLRVLSVCFIVLLGLPFLPPAFSITLPDLSCLPNFPPSGPRIHILHRSHHRIQQTHPQKGPRQHLLLGPRRPAPLPQHVGALLPGRDCHHLRR